MCDHLEEAIQQLATFCEVQESLGNIAVKICRLCVTLWCNVIEMCRFVMCLTGSASAEGGLTEKAARG